MKKVILAIVVLVVAACSSTGTSTQELRARNAGYLECTRVASIEDCSRMF